MIKRELSSVRRRHAWVAVEVWLNTAEEAKMEDELWDIEDG